MPRTPIALVTPEVLVWARQSDGLDPEEVAEKMGVSTGRIRGWEAGEEKPSIAQARKMARVYKRPLAVLFLPSPPKGFQVPHDFRRLAGFREAPPLSPEMMREVRRATELREVALELVEDEEEIEKGFESFATLSDNPEELASRIRRELGVSLKDQNSWRDPFEALRAWRDAIEAKRMFAMQSRGISIEEMRAFSVVDFPFPVIVLNSKDRAHGRIFSLLHELVHISLKQGGICKWTDADKLSREERVVEVFCNHVAGAILVPAPDLLNHPLVRSKGSSSEWSNDELRSLSRSFSVSREVILRRLLVLECTSKDFYEQKRAEFLREYEKLRSGEAPPIVSYPSRVVNRLGRGYIELVLDSFYARRVTLNTVSDLLGVRIQHIPDIEHEVIAVRPIEGTGL